MESTLKESKNLSVNSIKITTSLASGPPVSFKALATVLLKTCRNTKRSNLLHYTLAGPTKKIAQRT